MRVGAAYDNEYEVMERREKINQDMMTRELITAKWYVLAASSVYCIDPIWFLTTSGSNVLLREIRLLQTGIQVPLY